MEFSIITLTLAIVVMAFIFRPTRPTRPDPRLQQALDCARQWEKNYHEMKAAFDAMAEANAKKEALVRELMDMVRAGQERETDDRKYHL